MRLSIHPGTLFREAAVPVGQARPHPAICNSSQPFPPTSLASHTTLLAARTITDRGYLPSPPKQSQLTAAQAKSLFMRQAGKQDLETLPCSLAPDVSLDTHHGEAVRRGQRRHGTLHACTAWPTQICNASGAGSRHPR